MKWCRNCDCCQIYFHPPPVNGGMGSDPVQFEEPRLVKQKLQRGFFCVHAYPTASLFFAANKSALIRGAMHKERKPRSFSLTFCRFEIGLKSWTGSEPCCGPLARPAAASVFVLTLINNLSYFKCFTLLESFKIIFIL